MQSKQFINLISKGTKLFTIIDSILTEVEITNYYSFNFASGEIIYIVKVLETDKINNISGNFYLNVEDFIKNIPYLGRNIKLSTFINNYIENQHVSFRINEDELYCYTYILENGEICKKDLTDLITDYYFTTKTLNISNEEYYKTPEEVYFWNDVSVSTKNGTKINKAPLKSFQLNFIQKELINKFKKDLEQLKNNNIGIIFDNEGPSLSFINTEELEIIENPNEKCINASDLLIQKTLEIERMDIPYNIYYYQDGIYGYKEKEMKKKYIKPEIKTIKIDSEPCMNNTSWHGSEEKWVCPCEQAPAETIDELFNKGQKYGK